MDAEESRHYTATYLVNPCLSTIIKIIILAESMASSLYQDILEDSRRSQSKFCGRDETVVRGNIC
jgi:hypothetical protein